MTPLKFAAQCALGLVRDVKVLTEVAGDGGAGTTMWICLSLQSAHSVETWNAWRSVFGDTRERKPLRFSADKWQDAILAALTERHATADHIALPDGSVPHPVTDAGAGGHRVG